MYKLGILLYLFLNVIVASRHFDDSTERAYEGTERTSDALPGRLQDGGGYCRPRHFDASAHTRAPTRPCMYVVAAVADHVLVVLSTDGLDAHVEVAHSALRLESLAQIEVVSRQEKGHLALGHVLEERVRAAHRLVGSRPRVQLVENAEVSRVRRTPVDLVEDVLASPSLGLEEAVAPRRVGDVHVAVQLVVRHEVALSVEATA